MPNTKYKTTILTLALLTVFGLGVFAFSAEARSSERLLFKSVKRLTHPYYAAGNIFYSARPVFNLDNTKIWIYESPANTHPSYGKAGRGLCWGNVADLKTWTTVQEYETACKPFPNNSQISDVISLDWSRIAGEENIAYAAFKDGWLKRIDVSAASPDWVNYIYLVPPGASPDETGFQLTGRGWDDYNHLVYNLNKDGDWSTPHGSPEVVGYEIDIIAGTRSAINNWYSDSRSERVVCLNKRYSSLLFHGLNIYSHGHGDDRSGYQLDYGDAFLWRNSDCNRIADPNRGYPYTDHVDWDVSPEWFLGDGIWYGGSLIAPRVENDAIVQSFVDLSTETFGEKNIIYYQPTAHPWTRTFTNAQGETYSCEQKSECPQAWHNDTYCTGTAGNPGICKKKISNYHTMLLPKLNNNGTAAVYTATEGKFSWDDYENYVNNDGSKKLTVDQADMIGLFLIEFQADSDTTPPAAPTGVTVE